MEKQEECGWYSLTHLPDPSPTLSSIIDTIEFSVLLSPFRKRPRCDQSRPVVKLNQFQVVNLSKPNKNQKFGPLKKLSYSESFYENTGQTSIF